MIKPSKTACQIPREWLLTSKKQDQIERQGCQFAGQELLDNHELDLEKPCYCGRPNKKLEQQIVERTSDE